MTRSILMWRDVSGALPEPVWPEGIVRVPLVDADPREIHALLSASYEEAGRSMPGFLAWWDAIRSDEEFDPLLCFIAQDPLGHIVGFALCRSSGFIRELAVHADYRRLGLASALLAEAFQAFSARGVDQVALRVEEENAVARHLYDDIGFAAA
ncbi:GNAT family N-acetyltransferase [Arsenicitalea aurantiaca]|uniref:GNAT family N-acetyltransferase n=1 Tax=Arsenicitalea aurantiaca TaxID=1783274 RepID=A0A433XM38_9HYPH|nr:GNAT family N-acetyltransferase [Arsenicitalea aurantiaca]RUT35074.1 GNAT family N-acetyltransferase [Arsenicitalea aurantiaca]